MALNPFEYSNGLQFMALYSMVLIVSLKNSLMMISMK